MQIKKQPKIHDVIGSGALGGVAAPNLTRSGRLVAGRRRTLRADRFLDGAPDYLVHQIKKGNW